MINEEDITAEVSLLMDSEGTLHVGWMEHMDIEEVRMMLLVALEELDRGYGEALTGDSGILH